MTHRIVAIIAALVLIPTLAFAGPAWMASAVPAQQAPGEFYREAILDADREITIDVAATGTTGWAGATLIAAQLDCTEDSGTATIDAAVQRSVDGGTTWADIIAFTQLAATGSETLLYADLRAASAQMIGDRLRAEYDVGGSGVYTCSVYLVAES